MDASKYLEIRPAPRAIFDALPARRDLTRFVVGDRAITFGEVAREIEDVALFLAHDGHRPTDRGAIFAQNRVEWMSAALAIQSAGGTMVPVYPSSTTEQVAYVLGHSDARVVFVAGEELVRSVLRALPSLPALARIVLLDDRDESIPGDVREKVITWSAARARGRAIANADPSALARMLDAISLDSPAIMLYTSGTSGPPKGVPLTHRNVGVNGRDWLEVLGPLVDEGMTDLLWLPMSHVFGFGEACIGNTLGWTSYLADPASVVARLPEVKPSAFMSVPVVWEKLAQAAMHSDDPAERKRRFDAATGGNLRFCLSGGAGLKREVKELFLEMGALLIEGYGLTEASPTLTMNRPDAFRFDSVGKPFPNVELRLADDGEILAKGESIFAGYHKDPAATREAFTEDGWLKTGDVGVFTEDGFLRIVDRKKDILVTSGGKNVPPANIEQRFADDPLFQHVVVYGDGKKYLVAGVWLNPLAVEPGLDGAALHALVESRIAAVNAQLARYESIKRFVILEPALSVASGHLTPTLKVKRKAVYATFGAQLDALYERSTR
ncbi:AMP-dependent synthetase/ligase [Sandaracinus amylolyticus]|uniref:Long-chain-fatty-acid--CoA ligase n=1 Tax=Sandaracinus amylolyticus TaxID=927083 RepID=A0A0F6WA37_9BACT|nr:AMP-dependent synthetase/ligase [Sandaracinus amylolyticus]AKF11215.1 Long-chain-fatty-acid--CoA ligase [Sandaracinus amylolyticus]